jgi:hypothetical protein
MGGRLIPQRARRRLVPAVVGGGSARLELGISVRRTEPSLASMTITPKSWRVARPSGSRTGVLNADGSGRSPQPPPDGTYSAPDAVTAPPIVGVGLIAARLSAGSKFSETREVAGVL